MGGAGYFDYFARWMTDALLALQQWLSHVAWQITHDPVWAGITLAVIAGLVLLYLLKRKASGG